jgi:hypothetical protein
MTGLQKYLRGLPAFLAVAAMLGLAACRNRETGDPIDLASQAAYFPLEMGRYVDYAVDSVVYDFGPGGGILRDSSHTLVRELIGDTLRDNAGQLVYAVERYERQQDTEPWQLARVWTAARTAAQAVRTEDNLRFLRLVFPLDDGTAWDGNLWIDANREIEIAGERMRPFTNWRYEIDSIDVPGQVGAFAFDSLLVVTEADDVNAIERRLSRVRYAKNVGLVHREQWILDSQYCNQIPPPADCLSKPWEEKAERGYIIRQTVIGFN